jgi:hypothetical protein
VSKRIELAHSRTALNRRVELLGIERLKSGAKWRQLAAATSQWLFRFLRSSCRSFTAEFCEHRLDLLLGGKAASRRGTQSAVDAGQFLRRRLIYAVPNFGVEFEREVGKLVLHLWRPRLDALQNVGQFSRLHGYECSTMPTGRLRQEAGAAYSARGKRVLDSGAQSALPRHSGAREARARNP